MTKIYNCEVCQDREIIENELDAYGSQTYKACAGKEKPTEWIQSMYYRMIDRRYRNGLLTGFTTNYYPNELEARLGNFGEATVSRILGMTKNYFLCARDYDHRTTK